MTEGVRSQKSEVRREKSIYVRIQVLKSLVKISEVFILNSGYKY
jgi:hypothetical protein